MPKKPTKAETNVEIPPALQGDDKPSVIMRAAHKLFLRDGLSATSMDAVTQEAGVSKATVYAHFPSKQILFESMIRTGSDGALQMVPPLQRVGKDPREELLAYFQPLLHILFDKGGYRWTRVLVAEATRHPENAEFFHRSTIQRITAGVQAYLEQTKAEGVLQVADPQLAAESLIAMVILGPMLRILLIGDDQVDYARSLHTGVETFLASLPPS